MRQVGKEFRPVASAWVTLHCVGPDSAGPLDSMRTNADGHYAFRYRRVGSAQAIYFVSSSHDGIAYFSQPLRTANETGDDAAITVFDTTSRPLPLSVRGRHLIVAAPGADQLRTIVEVFEISNDTSLTLIAGGAKAERPTWSTIVPDEVTRFRVGQGDVPADAVALVHHRADVFAPFAPGVKQFSVSYGLPPTSFPLRLPLGAAASVLEVLVEEPAVTVRAPGLHETNPVAVEGRTFRRFLAQNAPASALLDVDVPAAAQDPHPLVIAMLIAGLGAAMLVGLALAFTRRPVLATAAGAAVMPSETERLAGAIVALDNAFAGKVNPSEEERAAYAAERDALKSRLTAMLPVRAPAP